MAISWLRIWVIALVAVTMGIAWSSNNRRLR